MPHGGIVDLVSISVTRKNGAWYVILKFADSIGRRHTAVYGIPKFLQALKHLDNPSASSLDAGLAELRIFNKHGEDKRVRYLALSGSFEARLDSAETAALDDLRRMLKKGSGTRDQLQAAMEDRRAIQLENPRHH